MGWRWSGRVGIAAWSGKFVHRRASLLSPALLAALYPGDGEPTDHAALREVVGDRGRYDRAMAALQRNLLVTANGVRTARSGWPATIIDLTCRVFDVGGGPDHGYAVARFVDTMIEATPGDLARAFGWPVGVARQRLATAV